MYGRLYWTGVIGLWLASMSWLVVHKVLPPLQFGDPPSYGSVLRSEEAARPVGWKMLFNDRPLGWAITSVEKTPEGGASLHSHVRFNRLPLGEMGPSWLFALWWVIDQPVPPVKMDVESTVEIGAGGDLVGFHSQVCLEPLASLIELVGRQQGDRLVLTVQTGEMVYTTETRFCAKAFLGDALTPQAELQGLYLGRTWTVPIYSPLRPPNSPVEIYRASVDAAETVSWQRRPVECWVVAYRSESGFASSCHSRPDGRLWVSPEGAVLKQEAVIMDHCLVFERLSDSQSEELIRRAKDPKEITGSVWDVIGREPAVKAEHEP